MLAKAIVVPQVRHYSSRPIFNMSFTKKLHTTHGNSCVNGENFVGLLYDRAPQNYNLFSCNILYLS